MESDSNVNCANRKSEKIKTFSCARLNVKFAIFSQVILLETWSRYGLGFDTSENEPSQCGGSEISRGARGNLKTCKLILLNE